MPHYMIILILYINLINLSWIKNVCFEEYVALKTFTSFISCLKKTCDRFYWLFFTGFAPFSGKFEFCTKHELMVYIGFIRLGPIRDFC